MVSGSQDAVAAAVSLQELQLKLQLHVLPLPPVQIFTTHLQPQAWL
jgi:hypothetical protein